MTEESSCENCGHEKDDHPNRFCSNYEPRDPRDGKPWPPEEDCKGCPNHKDGPHKLGCLIHGKNQLVIQAKGRPVMSYNPLTDEKKLFTQVEFVKEAKAALDTWLVDFTNEYQTQSHTYDEWSKAFDRYMSWEFMATKDDVEDEQAAKDFMNEMAAHLAPDYRDGKVPKLTALFHNVRARERQAIEKRLTETVNYCMEGVKEIVGRAQLESEDDEEILIDRTRAMTQAISARNIVRNIIEERNGSLDGFTPVKWIPGVGFVYDEKAEP